MAYSLIRSVAARVIYCLLQLQKRLPLSIGTVEGIRQGTSVDLDTILDISLLYSTPIIRHSITFILIILNQQSHFQYETSSHIGTEREGATDASAITFLPSLRYFLTP